MNRLFKFLAGLNKECDEVRGKVFVKDHQRGKESRTFYYFIHRGRLERAIIASFSNKSCS